jgi:uncharacterized DUF497 family protein
MPDILRGIKGFGWDEGNSCKNERKHGVTDRESEEVFFNKPLVVAQGSKERPRDSVCSVGENLRQPALDRSIHRPNREDSRD